ncbi:f-box protein [Nicotiana attenuata]|uniref:F-box protein n=1 Tax=Nicotiana attenuata TaxID=49451 RepID=A0A1J6IQL0_NICAT|nr:f-box protein [Nicotiana attenuata]
MKKELWSPSNDMLFEVLPKLSTKDLLKLKCVSKEWQCLISDRSFIQVQLKNMEPPSGFFYQGRYQWCDEDYDWISYMPISGSVATEEVHNNVLDFLPENIVILDSRYGLVCCRSIFPCNVPLIYICNPVNKEWKAIQWPNPSRECSITLVFEPLKKPIDEFTKFKVVIVSYQDETSTEGDGYGYFSFNIYSSETGLWRRSGEICYCNRNMLKKGCVCVKGIIYWLTDGDQILMFDPENEISLLISIPLPRNQFNLKPEMCLGEAEGRLHYVLICEHGLQLWVLEDRFTSQWDLTYTISLKELENENNKYLFKIAEKLASNFTTDDIPWIGTLAFKDNILLMRVSVNIYLYHFETRKMRHLCSLSALAPKPFFVATVVPYTMSLVPLSQS